MGGEFIYVKDVPYPGIYIYKMEKWILKMNEY
jgi:hypothetical protein